MNCSYTCRTHLALASTPLLRSSVRPACRIVTDRETGKQKGFAFIEYYEPQTAQSAVRNLDQADLTGRKLKVTFAQKDMDSVERQRRGADAHTCMHAVPALLPIS